MKGAFFTNDTNNISYIYSLGRMENLSSECNLIKQVINSDNFDEHLNELNEVEVGFGTWGLTTELAKKVAKLPNLKVLFYAAGSVNDFAPYFIENGKKVVSAASANAIPVAQFTFAQILLSFKGYYQNLIEYKDKENFGKNFIPTGPGVFKESVSLLGFGNIAKELTKLLKTCNIPIHVYDPYLSHESADAFGVRKVSLPEAFSLSHVVSNHMPNKPETVEIINYDLLKMMRNRSTFINTGRGEQVNQFDLENFLLKRKDVCALLDVTVPFVPPANSFFYSTNNVFLTSHIAGSMGDEVVRMADYIIDEYLLWKYTGKLDNEIKLEQLKLIA
ncbi:phosphoglycerate dehydrogenase [Vibrio sp. SCSIO 43132]|uniref:NAD(P)-dependent oxidoreductase n=1 Tax=Vibrio sp. SCSIO 43132 TaxID=2779363 RepID=UPI001CA9C262|nr:NAD(P)-dependent oxidoreductase [Vibrio sp. SCSIO 43132]UAB69166.1 phosphoglycerate dehydrogenase [Vibrio sp. SCSIO 43132]